VNELWNRLVIGAQQIGTVLPALLGATVILLTGYFLARQVQRWADDTLKRLNFDRVASAGGLD
jgi:small-conductance mechanosensitive channel